MIRRFSRWVLCGSLILLVACSKRERSDPEEWSDVQALSDGEAVVQEGGKTNVVSPGEFGAFIQRLEEMKSIERKVGETLLTGETLVFDQDKRYVRMERGVRVVDDRGELETERLVGRFSVSNEVEYLEAKKGVVIRSEGREARAEQAVYNFQNGFIQLVGQASASEGGTRLSGERIEMWIKGDRKMSCEPNALLEIPGGSGLVLVGGAEGPVGNTEVRADKVVYDESKALVELEGNVRIRDPRAAMNCETLRIFLKDNNEIDWMEAQSEVIIQSEGRKALAKRATYHADEGKFTLEGDPKVMQGLNVMTGDRITFWHETRRMVCEPNARVLLYLDEETKAKFLNDLNE